MNQNPSITGLGLITPLGRSADETWQVLLAGRFIRDHSRAMIEPGVDRIHRMAIAAAKEALAQAQWTEDDLADPFTAMIVGTSKGPVEKFLLAGESCDFGLADLTTTIARELKLGSGPRCAMSAACASGLHALIQGILLLRNGVARRVLVVSAEASVHPMFVGSFRRLGVIPPEGHGCRPFDVDRQGFLISEAAAAVCLEFDRNVKPLAAIDRFALCADATHLTGGDPNGGAHRYLLHKIIDGRPIDLIHAHGTGTLFNDPIELTAIESQLLPGHNIPNLYSHKSALGHSLGAAGLVAIVLNCLIHQTGTIPGNVQTRKPIDTKSVCIDQNPVKRPVHRSMAIAAGFGGAMAGVSLIAHD